MRMTLPNQLSLLRIFLTPVFVFFLFLDTRGYQIVAFVVFTIASITDWYDGYIARKTGEVTIDGQFLDPLADKILVSSGLVSFSVYGYIPAWMVLVIAVRDLMMTAMRSYAIYHGNGIRTNFFAKVKTSSQCAVIYLYFLFHLLTWPKTYNAWPIALQRIHDWNILSILMYTITIVTVISLVLYLFENKALIREIYFAARRKRLTVRD
jgi:CDP-diacylglycerol--glycerol-3-phosphate 3-phosphatidyltransferase